MRIASLGHVVFAATMIGLGILGLIKGDFTPIWSGVPQSMAGREMLAYLCAIVSLATGVGLLWQSTAAIASRVLLVYLLAWMLLFRLLHALFAPIVMINWWPCGESAVMVAAAWVLYVWFAGDLDAERFRFATGDNGLRIARVFYGLGLIPFGVAHFAYLKETVVDVPGWLPLPPVAWAYLTGATYIAAGVAIVIGVFARLAATLSAWQMLLFTVLVWIPIVIKGPTAFQWNEFVDSCTLTAAAWVVVESYREARRLDHGHVEVPGVH